MKLQRTEVRSLVGKLLHTCEVVRPGKFLVRRILAQLGMPPINVGRERFSPELKVRPGAMLSLGQKFYGDVGVRWLLV